MSPLYPALLFVVATPAVEPWGLPDFGQSDKQAHAGAGLVLGAVGAGVGEWLAPRSTWFTRALIGVATAAVVGAAKEAADARSSRHDCDPKDFVATVAGGTVGALTLSLSWRF